MARALSKSQLAAELAASAGVTKKAAYQMLNHLTALAYKHAKDTFTLPGIGNLVLVNRKSRMGRNPSTQQPMLIPAKRVLAFRISKAAKDAILGGDGAS